MFKIKQKIIATVATIALTFSIGTPAFATTNTSDFTIIQDAGNGNVSFAYSATPEKNLDELNIEAENYVRELQENVIKPRVGVTYHDSLSDTTSTAYKQGYVKASFQTYVYVDSFPGYIVQINGSSQDQWTGSLSVTSIDSSDTFTLNTFLLADLTLSAPPGVSATTVGNSLTINYPTVTNKSTYTHSFTGIEATTSVLGSVNKYTHTHSNTFLFGNHTESCMASDSITIW